MGYIVRRELGQPKYSPVKDNTNKFKDDTIRLLFYDLNHNHKDLRRFYGVDIAGLLSPISPTFGDYAKLTKLSSGKFNAYAKIAAVSNDQLYRSPIGVKNDKDILKFSDEDLKTCAEENCKQFVEAINEALQHSANKTFHSLEAVLMNKEFDIVKIPGYGTKWTTVLVKFRYKK